MTPESFAKAFAAAFGAQDAGALAGMLAEEAGVVSLTGGVAESRAEAEALFAAEFAGTLARARLVTGKARLMPIGPGGAVLHQRYVVTGLADEAGQDLPRLGAMLVAVLLARAEGWRVASLTFSVTA